MKHVGKTIDKTICAILEQMAEQRKITCASVHAAAKKLGISPAEAGIQADLMELRLKKCTLGLFGYEPDGKDLNTEMTIPAQLRTTLKNAAKNNRITCSECWKIARETGTRRVDVASACELMEIKIKQCQLGAF